MKKTVLMALITALMLGAVPKIHACTNYLITKGASTDGSTMVSYAADSHLLYGELYHWPAAVYPEGAMLDIYEWDTGKYLGKIKQAKETYNVVGNMNQFQVAIGETTYGGRSELRDTTGIMDYGSLIYVTLQRAKTAREAIKIMTDLVAEYGYYSSGESFSIADPNEVWIMEMISKGPKEKGAVWVARKIPDGYVSGHANQARITTFPLNNNKSSMSSEHMEDIFNSGISTVYAKDVVSFAREMGWFEGKDEDFSFSDTYAPVDFGGARFCEIRVWTMFNQVTDNMDQYWEYVKGNIEHEKKFADGRKNKNGYATNRMPLWVKPNRKISVQDMMHFMRDHLENTELDMSQDVGAGAFQVPYRWRPLTWKVDDVSYCNERATATQQTGFVFVSQSRSWLPNEIGGVLWFGVDDASSAVFAPMYSSITQVPHAYAVGNGAIMEWSDDAAFWVFNQVTNLAYTRYNTIHPEVAAKQKIIEGNFVKFQPAVDAGAKALYEQSPELAVEYLTNYSCTEGDKLVADWKEFYEYLFMKYMDGNVKEARPVPEGYKYVTPKLEQPGYGEDFYRLIIEKTGEQFKVQGAAH